MGFQRGGGERGRMTVQGGSFLYVYYQDTKNSFGSDKDMVVKQSLKT